MNDLLRGLYELRQDLVDEKERLEAELAAVSKVLEAVDVVEKYHTEKTPQHEDH